MSPKQKPQLPTEEEVAAAKAKAKPELTLEAREAKLREKYPDKKIVKGSMQWSDEHKKFSVEMKLDCGHIDRVHTSDVFQVKQCHDCKKAKSKEKLAALKAKDKAPAKKADLKVVPKAGKAAPPKNGEKDDFAPPKTGKAKKVADLLV